MKSPASIFSWFLALVYLSSCSCDDETLRPVCPAAGQNLNCVITAAGDVITQGAEQSIPTEYSETGLCQFGISTCVEIKKDNGDIDKYQVICEGYVGPVTERCDQQDNDCDGAVDEDFDIDGDGWTQCDSRGKDCWDNPEEPPSGLETVNPDMASHINPGAIEVCDGLDNNCDCWNNEESQDTNTDGLSCSCSTDPDCFGPSCCDAGIDENITPASCFDGVTPPVMAPESKCHLGYSMCNNGGWSDCMDQESPTVELCNGLDDDCDGDIDNNIELSECGYNEVGICHYGQNVCVPGTYEVVCTGAVYPQNEACNGLDDDCDGDIDEELWNSCETQCGHGVSFCSSGVWVNCSAAQPSTEICDGIDNDCDGRVDNVNSATEANPCGCRRGDVQFCTFPLPMLDPLTDQPAAPPYDACGKGVQYCDGRGEWGPCYFFTPVQPEDCNSWDDDCDGQIDGMQSPCWTNPDANQHPTNEGSCQLGTSTCIDGEWGGYNTSNRFVVGLCEGEVWPREETCNNLDDDCDGEIDEELNPHEKVDMIFLVDGSGSMSIVIDNLRQAMATYASDFVRAECPQGSGQQCHRFALLVFPGYDRADCMSGPMFAALTQDSQGGYLVDVGAFQAALTSIPNVCAEEPSYDVAYEMMDPNNLQIGWRQDAYPYVVLITDEPAQTWSTITDADVGNRSSNCQVGECVPGDPYEIYVITQPTHALQWNLTTLSDPARIKNLWDFQQSVLNGTLILQQIFQNVCLP